MDPYGYDILLLFSFAESPHKDVTLLKLFYDKFYFYYFISNASGNSMATVSNDDVCSVCLEALDTNIYVACCKHLFHKSCVKSLTRCPLCRGSWAIVTEPNYNYEVTPDRAIVDLEISVRRFLDRYVPLNNLARDERLDLLRTLREYQRREHNFDASNLNIFRMLCGFWGDR